MSSYFRLLHSRGRPAVLLSVRSFRSSSSTCPTFRKEVAVPTCDKSKLRDITGAPGSSRLLPTACSAANSRNASDSSTSTGLLSNIFMKWILAGGLGLGIYMYCNKKSVFETLPLCQASCKEFDSSSMRNRYNFIADAVEKASHSVVHINSSKSINTVFGQLEAKGAGSGFVVDNGEYVLTNAHVVSGATSLEIKLSSGLLVQGEVTDLDEEVDLALVKLKLPFNVSIKPAVCGDSTSIRPGEWVVAMGSPFSLSNTITCGVVSTVDRPSKDLGLNKGDMEYIQTDAPITIGNSGGPLVNLDGEVIGINVMTAHPGISFAIPMQRAEVFLQHASRSPHHTKKQSTRYVIGTSLLMLGPRAMGGLQYYYSIPYEKGILVSSLANGGPAQIAGLQRGDIVVKVNDKKVDSIKDLTSVVSKGERFSVEFYRKNKCMMCYIKPFPV